MSEKCGLFVHVPSKNRMQIFENRRRTFCLRSKRSAVRIGPGVPLTPLKEVATR
jgi:hypothetical protein